MSVDISTMNPQSFSFLDEEVKPPIAKTDIVQIGVDMLELINKLCLPISGQAHINYVCKSVTPDKKISMPVLAKRYHSEIRTVISERTALPMTSPFVYSAYINKSGYFALFLTEKPADLKHLLQDAKRCYLDNVWLSKHLLDLHIKTHLINKPTIFGKHTVSQLNSEMFLGTINTNYKPRKIKGTPGTIHDLLKIDTYLSKEMEFNISLIKQVYFTPKNEVPSGSSVLKDEPLLFIGSSPKSSSKKWDARKSQRNFMAFDAPANTTRELVKNPFNLFSNSIAYYTTYIQDCLLEILELLDIPVKQKHFLATHRIDVDNNVKLEGIQDLIVIDARTKNDTKQDEAITEFIQEHNLDIVKGVAFKNLEKLIKDNNYLIISDAAIDGSSIRDTKGNSYNSFISAYLSSKKIPAPTFDFYTSLKVHNFDLTEKLITQGLDGATKLKSNHTVERLFNELSIKKLCFKDKHCLFETNADGEYHLISVRRNSDYITFVALTKVSIKNNALTIKQQSVISSKDFVQKNNFNNEYASLKHLIPGAPSDILSKLYNDSFIIYNAETKDSLVSYHSRRVPNIIGNAEINSINLWHSREQGEATLFTQSALHNKCILPYYASRSKDFNTIFISDNNLYVDYFVTPHQPINSTVNKRNLSKRILVINSVGEEIPVLSNPLSTLYFDSHCSGLIKNKAVAYKTLLQKIAEAPLL